MNWLVRLYPPSWRKRYGAELEGLIRETPGRLSAALDLLAGAAIAYRDVVRANRVLSAGGAYLHGLSVAVLLQAIVFVSLVLAGQNSTEPVELRLGPVDLATVVGVVPWVWQGQQLPALHALGLARPAYTEVLLLAVLILTLGVALAMPRVVRALK